ncbi:S-adenosyl-methionine-sterol-C-methyltransferase [Diplogelasinospora grovesii]|uniref:S-adenosyl-methionine-sterol-C-methyltransferase n=1 Tax=Diplogelasinospora grovesii TaxID=303347 RepID=A0AAN6N9F2_9PEZI|nr:S-adenosyl-methionine-sterol-C-methyltransferase [Diplogelasinospora grovesii]
MLSQSRNPSSSDQRASDSSENDGIADEKRRALTATWISHSGARKGRRDGVVALDPIDRASLSNRFKTFRTSFKYLLDLTPKQVDDFMASYVIYNLDWADEDQMITELGPNYREKVGECLKAYYGVLNHLCALGDVEKMYIPPYMDKRATVLENQLLYERAIAQAVGLKPGMRALDLGCGRGRVAAHMATLSGAHVQGINIDPNQVAQAREFTTERGLQNEFVVHDFNSLPLPLEDASFDAFYQIQALSLCKDLPGLFRELFRVLRPGAKLSLLDWVSLPAYDPTNTEHVELMRRVKPLIGAVGTPTPHLLEQALEDAGFVVLRSENASLDGLQAPLIERADGYFRALRQIVLGLVKLRCLPPHFKTLINRLCLDGDAFIKMDKMRLASTSYWIVAEKPGQEQGPDPKELESSS